MDDDNALVPLNEQTISFYDDEIRLVIVRQGDRQQAYVPLRPICEFLDVAWSPQLRRINRDPILSEVMTSVTVTVTEGASAARCCACPSTI
jgi:hypothetical protein